MKAINLQISSCIACPYIKMAKLTLQHTVPDSIVLYCGRASLSMIHTASNAIDSFNLVNGTILKDINTIPDWCPLPNGDGDRT